MNKHDAFSCYHPLINFLYFGLIVVFSMLFMHPGSLLISVVCAFAYSVWLKGGQAIKVNLLYMLPLILLTALLNPLFNHEGATIITYFSSGNPLTLESITYGVAAALMIAAVICWFYCYSAVVSSDKFVYLFGRVIPALSLILAMTLRFVPKFNHQFKAVARAQSCLVQSTVQGSKKAMLRRAFAVISIMITWALENAVETADSMKSRGYGLRGRTAFSLYRWEKRDWRALIIVLALATYIIVGAVCGGLYWRYFPVVQGASGLYTLSVLLAQGLLGLFPLFLDWKEERQWLRLQSTI